jgi:hypothetical protein
MNDPVILAIYLTAAVATGWHKIPLSVAWVRSALRHSARAKCAAGDRVADDNRGEGQNEA